MSSTPVPLSVDQLRQLASLGERRAHSPLGEPLLLLALGAGDRADRALNDWLRALPAPVVGIGAGDAPFAVACDAVVDDIDAAASLIANVRRHPLAAMVFVQLLRLIEKLPITEALSAESLAYAALQNGPEFHGWRNAHPGDRAAPDEDGPAVVITREEDRLQLALNRPGNRNAMTVEMRDALCEALQLAVSDASIATIEIRARGKCFSTGGDLREFGTAPDPATAHLVRSLALPGRLLAQLASRSTAFVHGACIGSGIEFPAFAGRIVARDDAWFQLPELKYGLIPGAGGCISITRRIGRQRVAWLGLSGLRIDAARALDWGLVDAIAP
ncbi:enoyl-CoA hydratase/isomerase family protein [Solimonas terrae]|uniref:Enoyl-CoA hydratase/isomerase family protein n=1 Tax=Solimonas terrae TaxID=1396819 RepID=A0A6M2BWN7_9GAMM|nr:enoyl-CoA hydratase/isomerase family protein [Solimonas terrae]NGY06389.1 enoyl-CoA hydratase/isomerase family protein [Solimonas terrae]